MENKDKYKEAIEKIRGIYNSVRYLSSTEALNITRELEAKFPELKESEDDIVIKALKSGIRLLEEEYHLKGLGGIKFKKILAWLEKQGGQKSAVEMKTPEKSLGIDFETYNEIVDECIYGKQEPADKVEPSFKVKYAGSEYNVFETKYIAGVIFYGIEDEPNHIDYVKADNCEIISAYGIKENGSLYPTKPAKFSEQNHDWSEDDEYHVKSILSTIECCKAQFPNSQAVVEAYNADIDWLKSLKDRVQPLPKQEWSEEDKKLIDDTCHLINTLASGYGEKVTEPITFSGTQMIASIKDRLRALVDNRPQSHWKPSDEQMDALLYILRYYMPTATDKLAWDALQTLELMLEQLKKLK